MTKKIRYTVLISVMVSLGVVVASWLLEVDFTNKRVMISYSLPSIEVSVLPTPHVILSPRPLPTSSPSITVVGPINVSVPFMVQAPDAQWSNPLFEDGCEEAAIVMVMNWVNHQTLTMDAAKEQLLELSQFEDRTYGSATDRSATDTAQIIRDYYHHAGVTVARNVTIQMIITTLAAGKVVIAPIDGQALHNPYYTPPGSDRHMIVIKGYDPLTQEFITNDPGTRQGADYRYNVTVFWSAMRDYPTGNHQPIIGKVKNIVIVSS